MKSCSASLNELKPSRRDMGCIPQADGEFVACMEDVFDLYAESPIRSARWSALTKLQPNSSPRSRRPIPAKAGQLEHYDCEYKRNGTVNLFVFLDARTGPWRKVNITDSRAAVGFAACMREPRRRSLLKGRAHPGRAGQISTHSVGALYQAFLPPEARRLLCRLQFHYVPKHASWLSMVEIEIGVLRSQCLDRRIQCPQRIVSEVAAWERQRNASHARIKWMFTAEKARTKMGRAYTSWSSAKEA